MAPRRRPTSTSRFGVSRRENHDASDFYARFTAPELSADAEIPGVPTDAPWCDDIVCGDARDMGAVPTGSIALVVTSPPYFAGKEYEEALGEGHVPATYLEYLRMLEEVFAECVRTLEPGGRIAVNVANLGRRPYRSLSADVVAVLQDKLRLLLRGEVVWQKARGAAGSCAWGSYQRPANPVLRDLTERIVIASKGRFDRAVPARERARLGLPSQASLWADEFMDATTDVWEIPSESATRVGHPAPFPVELPERLIHLYTYRDDVVLDPFMGSGSTAVAAVRAGRHFAGYDTDPVYVDAARARVEGERRRAATGPSEGVALGAVRSNGSGVQTVEAAIASGRAAKVVAEALLHEAGFTDVVAEGRLADGVDVSFVADDRLGRACFVDVAGGFTTTRTGLRRTDTLWRVLGKAAVLHESHPDVPLVVLATDLPADNSPGHAALRAVTGPGRPIAAVVELAPGAVDAARRELARVAAGEEAGCS